MFAKGLRITLIYFAVGAPLPAQEPAPAPPPPADLTGYPDSEKGLRELGKDMLKAAKNGDAQRLSALAGGLATGDPTAWLKSVFGDGRGGDMATLLEQNRADRRTALQLGFETFVKEKLSNVQVRRFEKSCTLRVSPDQYPLLALREKPVPLYELRVMDSVGEKGRNFWFFVHTGGSFHYIGRFGFKRGYVVQPSPAATPPPTQPPKRIVIGGNVQQARLLEQVRPVYPDEAKQSGLQGTVKLRAVIGRDGRIHDLELISGHCVLAESAMKAVSQWRYQPTFLEGQPVEVSTTIDVVYTLRR
jgi:TonB family protein